MFDVFGSVKGLLKINSLCIDNNIFRLHYKLTVIILIAFSLIVTSNQYIGDPIDCLAGGDVPQEIMDTYCWIHSTFTLPRLFKGQAGIDFAHPGVGPGKVGTDTRKYHTYYQWVCFVLFFQAILFYVPRYLWKTWEGGRIKNLSLELNCPVVSEECKSKRIKLLVEYFTANLHSQNSYAFKFFICECLNFINVILQIYLINIFLGGEFSSYGLRVINMTELEPELRDDPMSFVFPKVTKCTFNKYGSSGSIETIDSMCVLPLNIVNEKIYVFLWFWFVILSVITGVSLLYRIATIVGPQVRLYLLKSRSTHAKNDYIIDKVAHKCKIGDWFVLYQLGKNVDPLIYKEFIADLAIKLGGNEKVV